MFSISQLDLLLCCDVDPEHCSRIFMMGPCTLCIRYHCNHRPRDVQVKDSEGAFFYQIITEKDESVQIAQVQDLLLQSFLSADLILSEVRKFKC